MIGHGQRWRVVLAAQATLISAWTWRFLCLRCRRTSSVRAADLLPGHRFTLGAILFAWFFAAPRPVGDGEPDEAVYALVGVDRRLPVEPFRDGRPRWRSLGRWASSIATWWPDRPVSGTTWRQRVHALIAGFLPGDGGRDGAVRRALAAHAAGGRTM